MDYIKDIIEGKSEKWIQGFEAGVFAFAYMKDGIYYVGTSSNAKFEEVQDEIRKYLEKEETKWIKNQKKN
jgi:hypothetical protein